MMGTLITIIYYLLGSVQPQVEDNSAFNIISRAFDWSHAELLYLPGSFSKEYTEVRQSLFYYGLLIVYKIHFYLCVHVQTYSCFRTPIKSASCYHRKKAIACCWLVTLSVVMVIAFWLKLCCVEFGSAFENTVHMILL